MAARTVRRRAAAPPDHAPQTSNQLELGWLEDTVGFSLRIAQEAAFRAYIKRVGDSSTPPWRFAVLALIDANPGLTQVALSRATLRDSSSLTPALDDLCDRGLVTRTRPEHDRRSYELRLTPRGKKAMQELKVSAEEHEKELDRLVGREQRAQFIQTLKRISAGLTLE